jgi:mono/diheme cytochrome c family protein
MQRESVRAGLRRSGAGRSGMRFLMMLTLTSVGCMAFASGLLVAQNASGGTVWDGVFTEAQASRGEAAYGRSCAVCHKEDLLGSGTAPALAGDAFFQRWNESTVDDVVQTMKGSMPQEAPGSLDLQVYVDIVTYLLKASGCPTGSSDLVADRDRLTLLRITSPPSR